MSERRNETPFVEFAAGESIDDGSTPATAIHIIEHGTVAIGPVGIVPLLLGPGECFGETALLQPPRAQRAVARTATRVLRIAAAEWPAVVAQNPAVADALLRQVVRRQQPPDVDAVTHLSGETPPPRPASALPPRDAAAIDAPHGTFVLDHAEGRIVLPATGECLVGRPDPATGAIPEVNLGPLDLARSLSRRHARLLLDGDGGIALREEPGVSNGTWVNGERLSAGREVALKRGDTLRFGAIEVELDRL